MNIHPSTMRSALPAASAEHALLGVVLAGGQSTRMGCDKATLPHPAGGCFLEHAITRLMPLTSQVAVSGRAAALPQTLEIPDLTPALGPAVAVWSAVRFAAQAGFSSILVTPVDMPDLQSSHLQQLIDSAVGDRPTCASFDGLTPHPLVAIYPIVLAADLAKVAGSNRRSLRNWLADRSLTLVRLPTAAGRDCNTPASCNLPVNRDLSARCQTETETEPT